MIGNFLDQYLITARLGSGSLGETYLAESVLDRSPVALKLINPELAAKPGLLTKIAELGQLNEPFVLPFTHEASGGQPYLLMLEYFPDNLQSYVSKLRLKGEEVPAETAVSLILHLISRLRQIDYSQLRIHGGLHPRNMLVKFVATTPEIILADFLQADMVRQATVADDQPVRGLAPFTPPWLWPEEEALPQKADSRADLFALGHLLYFLLKNEYVHVAKTPEENQALDNQYREVNARIIRNEKVNKGSLEDYVELAALTAVRLHPNILKDTPDSQLWQRWHHALLTMRRKEFNLTDLRAKVSTNPENPSAKNPDIDDIWHITDPLAILSPDAPEAQLNLPDIESEDTSANPPLETERPSDDETYIKISRPGAANGSRQVERFCKIRPNQGLITVGNHSDKDICLTRDTQVGPHHLNIRLVGGRWELHARGSGVMLNGTPIPPGRPEIWPSGAAVAIGSYQLRLHQPAEVAATKQIDLELLPVQLALEPGYKGKIGIVIRNNGNERSYFKVDKKDLGPLDSSSAELQIEAEAEEETEVDNWFTLPQDGLALNPGEQQEVLLEVRPPLAQASQTRLYQITVRRLGHSNQQATIQGRIFLQTTTDFVTNLASVSSGSDGAYRLIIRNKSNKRQTYQVNSLDSLNALRFAAVDTAVEIPQSDEAEQIPSQAPGTNGSRPPSMANNPLANRLLRRTGLGGNINSVVSEARRQRRNIQWAWREAGSVMPKSRLEFPKVQRRQLQFSETYQVEETVPPSEQAVIFLRVQPRKRPFRYQPQRDIPFTLVITPLLGAEEETREETTVLKVASRLSRPVWALLLGLLLFGCLLLTGLAAFETNNTASAFQVTQESARVFSAADLDGDGPPSHSEVALYLTNPQKRDSDEDGMIDGLEIFLENNEICPTKIDCDGDGIPDVREVNFATPTPTPPGELPFITAEPSPTSTRIPTVTPTSSPTAQSQPTQTTIIPYTNSDLALTLGDDRNNKQQVVTLSFNTANKLPANATIQKATFFAVMSNPEQYGRLQQELGNIYVTEGDKASAEQLGGLISGATDEWANLQIMNLAYNTDNILLTTLPTLGRGDDGMVTIRLFFELGSDLDGQADLLHIWSNHDQQSSLEHPPTLHIIYSLPGSNP